MRYKRESFFRYTFEYPLPAVFRIQKIDNTSVETSEGEAKVVDISPEGARLHSTLDIPETDNKSIELSISFELEGKELHFNGVIVWHKRMASRNEYGIDFLTDEDEKEILVKQLKIYSRKLHGNPSSV